ncbi:hypothetical protein GH714_030037 [Hevea brasiliensis]|uniref:Uncharacterized protein n=1 Tax=Hevea brasiliensis TaxID=3981 RepID=A0A6A6MLR5_HEVBR|nr:hypothetical protein GH714_030037 [Hevea brasiliensis]
MLAITTSSSSITIHPPRLSPPPSSVTPNPPLNPHHCLKPIIRRHLLVLASLSISPLCSPAAGARGLFQMPPVRLTNRYYLVRAGESEFESLGIINTNPVAKTSVDSGLSEKGKKQTVKAALELKAMGACDGAAGFGPPLLRELTRLQRLLLQLMESPGVPEYSFLDARGLGAYEGKNLDALSEVYESDTISPRNKPPPIDDGTPNESVADVFVRVTQLMSILETQYSGETIIIVSPDSDNLTILQAGLVGLDLRRHRDLSFDPGKSDLLIPVAFLLTSNQHLLIIVAINWKRYHLCTYPLHIWIVVDYTTVFVFRFLMFIDNGLAAGMGLDFGWQQRYARFCGRIVVLSILSLLLYPFLWAWTIIGTLWFASARNCVLVDMIRVPDWAFEAAGQEMRGMGQDAAAYHPGLYLTPTQREAVEALIQELPKFRLKAVPTDCSECPICLEEFRVGNEFSPTLILVPSNLRADSERPSATVVTTTRYVRSQPSSQSYLLRLQGLLRPVRTENAGASSDVDVDLEAVENGNAVLATGEATGVEPASSIGCMLVGQSPSQH